MYTCPKCHRIFKSANQYHSCSVMSVDGHFANKPAVIREIYDKLLSKVKDIGEVNISAIKSAIFLKTISTFMEIKPRRDYLLIAFYLDREEKEYPVVETLTISKNRIVHEIHLQSPDDIDEQLISLLQESYQLISKRK